MAPKTSRDIGRRNLNILRGIFHLGGSQQKALLQKADVKLIVLICECALNILRGNVTLSKSCKGKLRKHASLLRKLIDPKKAIKSRQRLLIRNCGFLPLILSPVLATWSMRGR